MSVRDCLSFTNRRFCQRRGVHWKHFFILLPPMYVYNSKVAFFSCWLPFEGIIAVCVCPSVIDLSETAHFAHWKSKTRSETFFSDNFFPIKSIFLRFCLGLNFVWDYIPQLYFVCNHLILLFLPPISGTLLQRLIRQFICISGGRQAAEVFLQTKRPFLIDMWPTW